MKLCSSQKLHHHKVITKCMYHRVAPLNAPVRGGASGSATAAAMTHRGGRRVAGCRFGIYRTAEALGVHEVWVILPPKMRASRRAINAVSKKAQQWLCVRHFASTE